MLRTTNPNRRSWRAPPTSTPTPSLMIAVERAKLGSGGPVPASAYDCWAAVVTGSTLLHRLLMAPFRARRRCPYRTDVTGSGGPLATTRSLSHTTQRRSLAVWKVPRWDRVVMVRRGR
jgi:hypothetical protein